MTKLGTIKKIWRYPVKGMRGEQLSEVYSGFEGVMGDRVYGVINAAGVKGFPWFTARDEEDYLLYKPHFKVDGNNVPVNLTEFEEVAPGIHALFPDPADFAVNVETPDGDILDIESSEFSRHLNEKFDAVLSVHRSGQRSQVDCRPLSLISEQTCTQLSDELDMPIDYRRFRPNFVVNWNNASGFYENELVGKRLRIGGHCEISILERDVRCKMITVDPDTGDTTPRILKHLASAHENFAGVWAATLVEGVIKAGDEISLV